MVASSSQLFTILYSTCIYTNFLCASPDDKSIVWSNKPYQPHILCAFIGQLNMHVAKRSPLSEMSRDKYLRKY